MSTSFIIFFLLFTLIFIIILFLIRLFKKYNQKIRVIIKKLYNFLPDILIQIGILFLLFNYFVEKKWSRFGGGYYDIEYKMVIGIFLVSLGVNLFVRKYIKK